MRIGIDSRRLQDDDRFRGIGAYLSSLLQAMSRIDRQNEYLLYAWTNRHPLEDLGVSAHSNFRLIPLPRRPIHITAGRLRNCLLRDVRVSPRDIDGYRTSSIHEVAGTAATLLEPSQDFARAVVALLTDGRARSAQIAAGYAQVGRFSWERTAAETLQVLREVDLAARGL